MGNSIFLQRKLSVDSNLNPRMKSHMKLDTYHVVLYEISHKIPMTLHSKFLISYEISHGNSYEDVFRMTFHMRYILVQKLHMKLLRKFRISCDASREMSC